MNEYEKAAVVLRLPSTLSAFSGGKSQLLLNADTVEQLLGALSQRYPLVWKQLCNEQGQVRKHMNIFVNNQLVSAPDDLKIALKPGQEVIILPAIVEA